MPLKHVLDERMLTYIQIYNLKRRFQCKCKNIRPLFGKTADLLRIVYLLS